MIRVARQAASLPPGTASKLYGTANLFEQGVFGKIGRAGLNAIKDRQYETAAPFPITRHINSSLSVLEAIIAEKPQRVVHLGATPFRRFVSASDAAYEGGNGTGGFLCVIQDFEGVWVRTARVAVIPQEIYTMWGNHSTYIAQLELLMVLVGLVELAPELRGTRGVWFIDNIAALMALVRGRSDSDDLDSLARIIHCALFALRTWIYFEWVESEANWSDGISRTGFDDPWHRTHGFSARQCRFQPMILQLPIRPSIRLFEFLRPGGIPVTSLLPHQSAGPGPSSLPP